MDNQDMILEKLERLETMEGKSFNVLSDKVIEGATLESSFVEVIRDNSLNKKQLIEEIKDLVDDID